MPIYDVNSDLNSIRFNKILNGHAFQVGAGVLNGANGEFFKAHFSNPANSGKNIYLHRIRGMAVKANSPFMSIRLNPTDGIPATTPRLNGSQIIGSGIPSPIELRAEASPIDFGGGVLSSTAIACPSDVRVDIEFFPVVVRPGIALGFSLPAGSNSSMTMTFYWIEESV